MFSKVYKAGVGSSGIVKDVAVLICLPVLHSGHLAGVTGRQPNYLLFSFKFWENNYASNGTNFEPHGTPPEIFFTLFAIR